MKNIIEVNNLVKNYKELQAVKGISFNVKEGDFFAFLGENGAGKSTTINILCTVLEKTSGDVVINGYNLDKDKEKIREAIGIVFQGSVLDGILTVLENLKVRASYYGLSGKELKDRLDFVINKFNLKDILNQKYETLSGGQKRRVDISRALINNPKILFLDEPTTGLDPQTRQMVWDALRDIRKKTNLTLFLTTHYMEETALADDVIILDGGKIVAHDTPHDLKGKYANDYLIWYAVENEENNNIIKKYGINFKYSKDAYVVKINNSQEATKIIIENQNSIIDYEVIKGDMDDVFLNITGKKLGE